MTAPEKTGAQRRDRLLAIIRAKSFSNNRKVTLASGRESWLYFNMKPTMLDPEGADILGTLMVAALASETADYIGGLEMGAVPLVAITSAASFRVGRPLPAFFVRKQAKGYGANALIEGLAPDTTLAGKRVVIAEDVTTTGGSALKAAAVAREAGAEIVRIVTLVDREEGAADYFAAEGIPFTPLFRAGEFSQAQD